MDEDLYLARIRWRWWGGGSHEWESKRQSDKRTLRFKENRIEAHWFVEGGQKMTGPD